MERSFKTEQEGKNSTPSEDLSPSGDSRHTSEALVESLLRFSLFP